MRILQAFLITAREGGFIDAKGSGDGTVLWLQKRANDAGTKTRQRMCIDSLVNSATIYWTGVFGRMESKTFRTVASLQAWIALQSAELSGTDGIGAKLLVE
jgi:hypothetical protein